MDIHVARVDRLVTRTHKPVVMVDIPVREDKFVATVN